MAVISRDAVIKWCETHGLDSMLCAEVAIHIDSDLSPVIMATMYAVDDDGHKFLDEKTGRAAVWTQKIPLRSWPPLMLEVEHAVDS